MINEKTIKELINEIETPFYVYDAEIIRENCKKITNSFKKYYPETEIHYAVKANSCPGVLNVIRESGLKVDCSSPFELLIADRCGFSKDEIMYTGNYESIEDLKYALEFAGILNLDDISSFKRLKKLALSKIVSFRINPGIGKGGFEGIVTGGVDAKFGIPYEKTYDAYELAKKSGVKRFGIHMMTGSNNLEPFYFAEITDKLMRIAGDVFKRLEIVPEYVDIGGGFGIPYKNDEVEIDMDSVAKLVTERFLENCGKYSFGRPVLRLEPGRYITGNAGFLVTKVTGLKESYKSYIGVDAGMNTLLRPALYGAFHWIEPLSSTKGRVWKTTSVCGRICENSDIFAKDISLPEMETGEILLFRDCGAYGYVMSSNYNGREKPGEVVVDKENIIFLRKKESVEKLVSYHFSSSE